MSSKWERYEVFSFFGDNTIKHKRVRKCKGGKNMGQHMTTISGRDNKMSTRGGREGAKRRKKEEIILLED